MLARIMRAIGVGGVGGVGGRQGAEAGPRKARLAACVLLLEAVHADGRCSQEELDRVVEGMVRLFGLEDAHARELMEAAHATMNESVDLWGFGRELDRSLSRQERLDVMLAAWRIIYQDGRLDSHEDHYAAKLATVLRLSHSDKIETKLRAKREAGIES